MKRLNKVLISPSKSIKHALMQMDTMGEKTLILVGANKELLGTITDGDIRRWILKGKSLAKNVLSAANCNPFTLREGFDREEVKNFILQQQIECIPIVSKNKKVIDCLWWIDLFENRPKIYKSLNLPVVIMAGGKGVRLYPLTKILPKPLIPIGDTPIIEMIINKFSDYGCRDFYLSLNYKSSIIKAYFSDFEHKYKIVYIQEDRPLGTAGSLHMLKNSMKGTFFVSNCDILIEADYADVLEFHREKRNKITLVSSMKNFIIPYGVCEIKNGGALRSIKEKPEYNFYVNTGMYVLEPSVLADIPKNKFYNITDLISDYVKKNEKIGVYPISEKSWLDMGQFDVLQDMLKKIESQQ